MKSKIKRICMMLAVILTITVQPVYASWYDPLWDFLSPFWTNATELFKSAIELFFYIISWVFYVIFDGILSTVYAFFSALDLSAVAFDMAAEWTSMPDQLIWLVNQLAIPQCLTIIVGAMGLRMLLNLIPGAITRI